MIMMVGRDVFVIGQQTRDLDGKGLVTRLVGAIGLRPITPVCHARDAHQWKKTSRLERSTHDDRRSRCCGRAHPGGT